MNTDLKLTDQEVKIVNFLSTTVYKEVAWEMLASFSKKPQEVKLKTIKKAVSEIKRKYINAGLDNPFEDIKFYVLSLEKPSSFLKNDIHNGLGAVYADGLNAMIKTFKGTEDKEEQTLTQVKRTPAGNIVRLSANILPAQADFQLDYNMKRVRTKFGSHLLNDSEWLLMKYFHANVGKIIKTSELRDKVVYEHFGSKLPARWFDAISRQVNALRRQVPGLRNRLLTVKGEETSYLFQ